jgi:hypothetical protein
MTTKREFTAPTGEIVSINRKNRPDYGFLLLNQAGAWKVVSAGQLKSCESQAKQYDASNKRHPDKPQFVFTIVPIND